MYVYEFTWPTLIGQNYQVPGWHRNCKTYLIFSKYTNLAVPHASELPLLWMQEDRWNTALSQGKVNDTDIVLANLFGETWTNFAKIG